MSPAELTALIRSKKSFLCVGLDTDPQRLPQALQSEPDPILAFNKQIITATAPHAIAYKINIAFYEALGPSGWETLAKTLESIPEGIFTIADAKRGDIGNTSRMYAKAFFESLSFDAITVAPYMGADSILPFLEFEGKWVFMLALTSNPGSKDFQFLGDPPLYQRVVHAGLEWESQSNGHMGFVVGATQETQLAEMRGLAPTSFFLVPGVGAQGGSLEEVCKQTVTLQGGLLINSSRSILYADAGPKFAHAAADKAKAMQQEMALYIP